MANTVTLFRHGEYYTYDNQNQTLCNERLATPEEREQARLSAAAEGDRKREIERQIAEAD